MQRRPKAPARHRSTCSREVALEPVASASYDAGMFTIEHDFDATVITLVDEGAAPLQEDVIIEAFEDCIVLQQVDPRTDEPLRITLSMAQVQDLAAAMNLPEGSYRLERKPR